MATSRALPQATGRSPSALPIPRMGYTTTCVCSGPREQMIIDPFVGRKVLGRYRIVRSIGRGGMGLIYLARQEGAADFVKPVVVKRATPDLLAQQPALREFMGREARIMSHLHHPAIVSV